MLNLHFEAIIVSFGSLFERYSSFRHNWHCIITIDTEYSHHYCFLQTLRWYYLSYLFCKSISDSKCSKIILKLKGESEFYMMSISCWDYDKTFF